MHSAIEDMLKTYDCRTADDCRHALKEITQEIALLGLYRGGFFAKAAFYGGTALRIFHGLDRFSEDLDFSLLKSDKAFDLSSFTQAVQDELGAYGLEMTVTEKIKGNDFPVKSAFVKGGRRFICSGSSRSGLRSRASTSRSRSGSNWRWIRSRLPARPSK